MPVVVVTTHGGRGLSPLPPGVVGCLEGGEREVEEGDIAVDTVINQTHAEAFYHQLREGGGGRGEEGGGR